MNIKNKHTTLKVDNLSIGYTSKKEVKIIASNLNFEIKRGAFICILGKNGIGKSTLLRTLSNVQSPITGTVFLNEENLPSYSSHELAKNLSSKVIYINNVEGLADEELSVKRSSLDGFIALETTDWKAIYEFLKLEDRTAETTRNTNETKIYIKVNLDGTGKSDISTGIDFFDHMLDQISRHGNMDLTIQVQGDLEVDEHHTIEDTMIALGEVFAEALGNKLGIERYGFCLPMDDCLAQVAIDFGGRNWLVWDADFKREMIGKMPTEMFFHLFKSFTDGARCNLNIKAEGDNEHHKIEGIFKAFAKAIKMAVKRDSEKMILPSTKGML